MHHAVIPCDTSPNIANGMVVSSTGTRFKDTTTYDCNTGYLMSGLPTVTCQATGSWSTLPSCTGIAIAKQNIFSCYFYTQL